MVGHAVRDLSGMEYNEVPVFIDILLVFKDWVYLDVLLHTANYEIQEFLIVLAIRACHENL